jgi:hypothetical protein
MELATFAYMLFVLELLVGIPLFLAPGKTVSFMKKFMKEDVLLRSVSALIVVIAALVLLENHTIGQDTAGLMRLVAWIVLIKHILMCWWPDRMRAIADDFLSNSSMHQLLGLLAIGISVLFLIAGNILSI